MVAQLLPAQPRAVRRAPAVGLRSGAGTVLARFDPTRARRCLSRHLVRPPIGGSPPRGWGCARSAAARTALEVSAGSCIENTADGSRDSSAAAARSASTYSAAVEASSSSIWTSGLVVISVPPRSGRRSEPVVFHAVIPHRSPSMWAATTAPSRSASAGSTVQFVWTGIARLLRRLRRGWGRHHLVGELQALDLRPGEPTLRPSLRTAMPSVATANRLRRLP